MVNIEHELRGVLTEWDFGALERRLTKEAIRIVEDSKDTHFFVVPEGMILKVVRSKDKGEFISFKVGDETIGGLEEYEIPIVSGVDDVLRLFQSLGFNVNYVPQVRTNYFLKNGIEVALKHTPDWGYHFEIEYIGEDTNLSSEEILQLLEKECYVLGIRPMSPGEIKDFIRTINERRGLI
jgi:adenylate cyclase class IV